jgi:tetratricopeptide (TPR) repeat protein
MAMSSYGQSNSIAHVKNISNDACNCISEINTKNASKNDDIKNCISKSLVKFQKSDKDNTPKAIDHESESFKKIQSYIVENCDALKSLMFAENQEFKHATSSNVLAQLAYDDGMEYMDENDYKSAIEKFEKAIKIDRQFAFAWDNLGVSYRKTNQYDKAIEAYKKSLKINPKGRLPLMNIAVAYNLNKEHKQAIKYYKKFIHNFEEDPEGYYGLGLIQYTNDLQEEGLDNLIHAYTIYTAQNSPYGSDAAKKIGYMYNDLKKQNKQDIFNKIAKKYNLSIEAN